MLSYLQFGSVEIDWPNRKTSIAAEYVRRTREAQPDMAIFWTFAANRSDFLSSYDSIALEVPEAFRKTFNKLDALKESSEHRLPKNKVPMMVKQWLDSQFSGEWLLILDNADDPNILQKDGDERSVSSYLPHANSGRILVTSRHRNLAMSFVGSEEWLVHIPPLTSTEAISLLRTRLPRDFSSDGDLMKLTDALDYMPLAIKQAIGYIVANRSNIQKYLQIFLRNKENQRRLLEKIFPDLNRIVENDAQESVVRTWQISFDQVRTQKPEAADLLSLMGMLDRNSIPGWIFRDSSVDDIDFEENLGLLLQYSLINTDSTVSACSMHRLVQLTIQIWLSNQHDLERWQIQAFKLISRAFPDNLKHLTGTDRGEKLAKCAELCPHAKVVLKFESNAAAEEKESLRLAMTEYQRLPPAWLSSLDFSYVPLNHWVQYMYEGTLDWTKNHTTVCKWRETPHSLLWLTGDPGTGKTIFW